jgi:opacity protein-like surface antigen
LACAINPALAGADGWTYEFTPYLLAAGMDGTAGVRDHEFDVDASFSDILDNLDGAFMALFTAQRGRWLFGLEGVYMDLEDDGERTVTGPRGNLSVNGEIDVGATMTILQASVGYRLYDDVTELDVIGGVRYTSLDLDVEVDVAFTPPVFGGSASADGNENWTDFVVGARVLHPLSQNVALVGYADIGGGGSDLTYQFIAGVNWEFSDGITAKVGYRRLAWDYDSGGTKWDIAASGPYVGVGFRF